jgi:DegV family protein with EDD domain
MRDNVRVELTTENTALVLDSTCDLRGAQAPHPNWRIVPLHVHFGDEVYRDHVDLDTESFYRRLSESSVHPHSSQPSPGDFSDCLETLAEYERIFVVTVSSKLSGTHQSATLAAEASGSERVVVVDGGTVSAGTVLLADAIQRRLERGTSANELAAFVSKQDNRPAFVFAVATLEYLIRGGRVSRAAGFAGELLSAKPILRIADGEIVPVKRVRGRARALAELERIFVDETSADGSLRVALVHADAHDDLDRLAERVRVVRPAASLDHRLIFGPVIGANTGPGSVALAWLADDS